MARADSGTLLLSRWIRPPGKPLATKALAATDTQQDFTLDEVDLVQNLLDDPPESPPATATWHSSIRLVLHAAEAGRPRVEALRRDLELAGAENVEQRRVDLDISTSHIRYYHPQDVAAAQAVARTLSAKSPLPVRDFTHFSPAPHLGLVELWVH